MKDNLVRIVVMTNNRSLHEKNPQINLPYRKIETEVRVISNQPLNGIATIY